MTGMKYPVIPAALLSRDDGYGGCQKNGHASSNENALNVFYMFIVMRAKATALSLIVPTLLHL
jgi:hypothetical protein